MGITGSADELKNFIVNNIESAIKKGDIKIYYQPIIRTVTGKVCAVEALTRWIDPVHGFLSPGLFIQILDDAGKLHILDSHVIQVVCRDIRDKMDAGEEPFSVSINLTKSDFMNCDIRKVIEDAETKYGIPPKYLCLEVSEAIVKDSPEIGETLSKIVEVGHERWLDDFGHGYSSFSALNRNYDVVKFDVRFIHGLGKDELEKIKTIIAYSINMVKKLHFSTLIEGIETEEEYTFFKELGCEMIQGYFFSRPMTLEDLDDQGFEIEARDERDYYNAIGQISTDEGAFNVKAGGTHREAMAVFEYKDDRISYLFQNEANKNYLARLGGLNAQAAEIVINQKSGVLQERIRPFVKEIEKGSRDVVFSYLYHGIMMNLKASFIAKNPRTGAVAFVVYTSVNEEERGNVSQRLIRSMHEIFTIFDRMDLIDFEDRIIKNSYINTTEYGGITEGATMNLAMEIWKKEMIYPEQQEEFKEFMNIDSVREKISKLRSKHLCRFFKTKMESGQYVEKEYILLPLKLDGREMLLAGIINIDLNGR